MCLSENAVLGTESPKYMRLVGQIQDHTILIPVDSWSSHTFLSQSVAQQLAGFSLLPHQLKVKVANGDDIVCKWQLLNAS
jgi:hypothetical protein